MSSTKPTEGSPPSLNIEHESHDTLPHDARTMNTGWFVGSSKWFIEFGYFLAHPSCDGAVNCGVVGQKTTFHDEKYSTV